MPRIETYKAWKEKSLHMGQEVTLRPTALLRPDDKASDPGCFSSRFSTHQFYHGVPLETCPVNLVNRSQDQCLT